MFGALNVTVAPLSTVTPGPIVRVPGAVHWQVVPDLNVTLLTVPPEQSGQENTVVVELER